MENFRTYMERFLNWHWDDGDSSIIASVFKFYVSMIFGLATVWSPTLIAMMCFLYSYDNTLIYVYGALHLIGFLWMMHYHEHLLSAIVEVIGAIWYYFFSIVLSLLFFAGVIWIAFLLRESLRE